MSPVAGRECPDCGEYTEVEEWCKECRRCLYCCECEVVTGDDFDADELGLDPEEDYD